MKLIIFTVLLVVFSVIVAGCTAQTGIGKNGKEANIFIQKNEVSVKCVVDDDCQLIDKTFGFSCCWTGACKSVDYSKENYIGVNKNSFLELQSKNCPSKDKCGPAPGCPSQIIDNQFAAKCVNTVCKKVPLNGKKENLDIDSVFGDDEEGSVPVPGLPP